ncbi:MAG: stage sporulation protein [Thermosediminibacterales bacterium]|nr:stage sporulation protein [Thermosediminibacterales bacterium]MDK2835228.1 stage sporulation protein [Thermosediminibacterales bacterium]
MARAPKKKPLTTTQKRYQEKVRKLQPRPTLFRNAILAFITGGIVCVIGQFITDLYKMLLGLSSAEAGNPAVATMIFIGALLTGLGVFDNLAKYAGAGLAVPVTGFANSVVSSALEFKREGLVLGVGSKMFMLAGSVITFGVVTAFFIGLIYAIFIY